MSGFVQTMLEPLVRGIAAWPGGPILLYIGSLVFWIVVLLLPLLATAAYMTLAERKIIGWMQIRRGPNRVGWLGLLQPLADAVKLLTKEIVMPSRANRILFLLSPVFALAPALAAWAVVPFSEGWVLSDLSVGVLYVFAMSSLSIYGILIAGWASNSKYALLSALRSVAQVISYELAMGFAVLGVVLWSGTLNLTAIVKAQLGGFWHWNIWPLFPLWIVYWIAAVAETNRAPFDVVEGESELVAGFHVEYSGMGFALFFLAEYANMILLSALMTLLFLGGWDAPWPSSMVGGIQLPGLFWMALKMGFFLFCYLWFRATFPRYRYDQIMRLGWKVLIPITLVVITGYGLLEAWRRFFV